MLNIDVTNIVIFPTHWYRKIFILDNINKNREKWDNLCQVAGCAREGVKGS